MPNHDQLIYEAAIQEGIKPTVAKFIVAQARLESADYTSPVFNCNNNMFGMKFASQPLATRGTIAPSTEISINCTRIIGPGCDRKGTAGCKNGDYYSKYSSPADSARDVVQRYYKKTMYGVTFDDLNSSTDVIDFAKKLKKRHYFGKKDPNTAAGNAEALSYAAGLKAKLILISVSEFYEKNKKNINYTLVTLLFAGIGGYLFYLKKKKII